VVPAHRDELRGERSGSRVDGGPGRSVQFIYIMKKTHGHFHVVLRPKPEGGFTVIVPALPGCVTYGRTLTEAKKMAKDAIGGYIESLKKHKEPIPTEEDTLVASLDLEYAETPHR